MHLLRLLRLTPWRRGPRLLARRPAVAVALLAAAAVAALPAAAAPMFLSSAEHATLHRQIDQSCQGPVGAQFHGPVAPTDLADGFGWRFETEMVGADRFHQREQVLAEHAPAGLIGPVSTGYAELNASPVDRPLHNPDLAGLLLLGRDGFQDHVAVVSGPSGEGLWLPHEWAELQGVTVGDELELVNRTGIGRWQPPSPEPEPDSAPGAGDEPAAGAPAPVTLPVAAIYRDLTTVPTSPFWCGAADLYGGSADPHDDPPLPAALVDTGTLLSVGEQAELVTGQLVEFWLADPQPRTPDAAALAGGIEALRATAFAEHPDLFPTGFGDDTTFTSHLDRFSQRAELVRRGLGPPVLPITAAGILVGLAVAGAAAYFWAQRRRQELAVLAAHGVGAGGLGAKAVLEALPAVVLGTGAGAVAAWGLVTQVGPAPALAPGTLPRSAGAAVAVGIAGLLLIGALATARARALADTPPTTRRKGRWARFPWELSLVAAAPVTWLLLTGDRVSDPTVGGVGTVVHVPIRLLVTPILVITGLTIFAARRASGWLHRSGPLRTPAGPTRLLAWRRCTRAAAATAVLAAATAIPVATAVFGATATDSIRTTADAKLQFNLGSDTVISYPRPLDRELSGLPPPPPPPAALQDRATETQRLNQQRMDGLIVDVLAVDPDTFPTGAYWDRRIPGASLADAVNHLSATGTPTVVASRRISPGPATLTIRNEDIPVQVADTRPLPGAQAAYPLVLVHRDLLPTVLDQRDLDTFTPQLWVAGDPQQTLALAADAELPLSYAASIDDHRVGAVYEPVTYTFQYLTALSIFTGLIGAIGLLLYLESRTAAHRRGYVLLRRLGLRAAAHRRALLLEIGGPVAAGLGTGLVGALALAHLLRDGFDINPARFPQALLVLPSATTTVVAAAAAAIAVGAGLLAHRRIRQANPAEVLRDTA